MEARPARILLQYQGSVPYPTMVQKGAHSHQNPFCVHAMKKKGVGGPVASSTAAVTSEQRSS